MIKIEIYHVSMRWILRSFHLGRDNNRNIFQRTIYRNNKTDQDQEIKKTKLDEREEPVFPWL